MFFFVLACKKMVSKCTSLKQQYETYLCALWLPHSLLHHTLVGLPDSSNSEVDSGTHLLNLDSGQALATLLGLDHVCSELDLGRRLVVHLLGDGNVNHVLQTLDIHIGRVLALEEVQQKRLGQCVGIGSRALECGSREGDQGLETNPGLCVLELRERAESLGFDVQLYHVEKLVVEHAHKGDGVGALLAVAAENHQRGVVFLAKKLERRWVFEGVNVVLLVELDAERALERV